ncbi:MAG: 16S rRNA (guanine(966)-N(2))-methyltransferase RsmD [Actinomycetota bacterium]
MRVIAGKAKGHRLKSPGTSTRPMADRMRESLFSALGDLGGCRILDLYAGSGALGLEALSRGAEHATFVENARDAIVKLEHNIDATGFRGSSEVVWSDVGATLRRPAEERQDLIFVDPPYSMSADGVRADLEALVMGGFLADSGRVVVHRPAKESALQPLGLVSVWERDFGQSHLYVYCHEEEEET